HKSAASVLNISEVARSGEISQADFCHTRGHLGDDRGNHRARGLPRTVAIEGTRNRHRQPERIEETQRNRIGADLSGAIGRLRSKWKSFVNRYRLRSAIDFTSRGLDES